MAKTEDGQPEIHYTGIYKLYARWCDDGSLQRAFMASVRHLNQEKKLDLSIWHGDGSNTVAKKGGDGVGYSGHKPQKGEKVLAMVDHHGSVLAPLTVAPVNHSDMVLLPDGLKNLTSVARQVGLELNGATLNLDAGFDSKKNRRAIFAAGLKPTLKENPRNRHTPKRGRKRFFDQTLYALRATVERVFAWEDKFRRLLLRFERLQRRHRGFKLLAYTLINIPEFCLS